MKVTRIRQGNGTLSKDWYVDYRVLGRRVRLRVGPNKKQAELVLGEIRSRLAKGQLGELLPEVRRVTRRLFRDFADDFEERTKLHYQPSTWARNKSRIGILVAFFGDTHLDAIGTDLVEEFRRHRNATGVSAATINREFAVLRRMLNAAADWGDLARRPELRVKALREPQRVFVPPSESEIKTLLQVCAASRSRHLHTMVMVALYAGLRRSEIFHLQWQDVDFARSALRVVSRASHQTKNNRSRTIPMNRDLQQELESWKDNSTETRPTALVFPGKGGQPLVHIATAWNVARRKAVLDQLRFHDLRHTFASYLVMQGEALRLVQELLGHRSLDMVQRYSHLRPEATRSAVEGLSFRERGPAYELRALPRQAHSA